ncbi:MAG TPA: translation initiation factor IF-6 [Candidatus Norongarragalinales archaeon]|nr:translation initiation factor IF-6 [Candidatus Norongarragalinales archaeon]
MGIIKTSFYKNPHIGLFIRANDKIALVPKNIHEKLIPQVRDALQTEIVPIFLCQSPVLGIFSALNSNGCVVSALTEKHEIKPLKELGLNVYFLNEQFAPGNNILANDKAALLNHNIPRVEHKKIGDCLGVEVFSQPVANLNTVGSCNTVTNKGLLAFHELTDVELKMFEKIFGVRGTRGTVNLGSQANSYGVVANSKGALVGDSTSGAEMQNVYEGLFG